MNWRKPRICFERRRTKAVASSRAGRVVREPIAEVAERGALHYGLRSLELDGGIEAFDHSAVAIAREDRPEFFQSQPAIHLGEATPRDIELERLRVIAEDGQFQRSAGLP